VIEFLIHNMAPIMFVALVVFLLLGYPVSFALSFVGLSFALIGIWLGLFEPVFLQLLPERVWQIMSNETLLAIPFFTFMGLILERTGMAEELLDTAGKLFGPVRGGVAYAVIVVGALLAATTGVVAASVIAMGLISLPIMLRYGYDRQLSSGVIAASGTLAQIIPPSLVLIIMADQLGRSVGDMYKGAIVPGLVLTGLYLGYVLGATLFRPASAPALPAEARSFGDGADYAPVMRAVVLPMALVLIVMIALFSPRLAKDVIAGVWPWLGGVETRHLTTPLASMLGFIVGPAIIYVLYLVALRFLPPVGARTLALLLALAAVLVLWRLVRYLAETLLVLPPLGESGWMAIVHVLVWLAGGWYYYLATAALLLAASSLWQAPIPPVGRAVAKIIYDFLPPLILIFLVLGTIFQGIATPTEGGAMGAVGALVLAILKRRLRLDLIRQALDTTTKLSAFVIFILIGARVFSLTFYGVDGHKWVEELLLDLPGGATGFLIFVNALVFVLAFFLDFFELAFIVVPLLGPVAEKLGIDLIWFGVLLGINMQTSFMHPPFGFALFYLRSVAPRGPYFDKVAGLTMAPVTTGQIYWGAVPFVVIQLIMVGLAITFPQMVMHYKGTIEVDPSQIEIIVPDTGGGSDLPDFGNPATPVEPPAFD
jgi:TRAP-type mannitol/chloroaromatic compound transport system permease large subunit